MAKTLGEQLRWLRQRKEMSLDQLASAAGISRAYVWKLERVPGTNPSIDLLEKLAVALEVPVSELVAASSSQGKGTPVEVPEALARCKEEYNLSKGDVEDLARIRFRGRRPTTMDEWHLLYLQLKQMLGDEKGKKA